MLLRILKKNHVQKKNIIYIIQLCKQNFNIAISTYKFEFFFSYTSHNSEIIYFFIHT